MALVRRFLVTEVAGLSRVSVGQYRRIVADAASLAYLELPSLKDDQFLGNQRPLIVLHGLLASKVNFRSFGQRPMIGLNRRVVIPDLRNHGDSYHTSNMDLELMGDDVIRLMDALKIERADLLGHSLGGRVAMCIGMRHRDRVERLIVADVAPVNYSPDSDGFRTVREIIMAAASIKLSAATTRKQVDHLLREQIPDNATRQFVLQNLVICRSEDGFDVNAVKWRIPLPHIVANLDGSLAYYDWPTLLDRCGPFTQGASLFIAGGKSDYIHPRHHPAINEMFPGAIIKTIDASGHWVHSEYPDQFATIVAEFLGQ